LGPRLGDFTTTPRRFPVFTHSRWRVMYVWCVETRAEREAALGCLALRIREIGPRIGDFTTTPRRFPVLTRSSWRVIHVWCMENRAERDAAVGCLALRICQIGPSTRRFHDYAPKIPCFDTFTVESDVCLVRENPGGAGCDVGLPRIAYSRNWSLDSPIS